MYSYVFSVLELRCSNSIISKASSSEYCLVRLSVSSSLDSARERPSTAAWVAAWTILIIASDPEENTRISSASWVTFQVLSGSVIRTLLSWEV